MLDLDGNEFWNYSCGGNINSVSVSLDSSTLAASSDDGAAYLFERNSSVFARLFGNEYFLSGEGLGLPLKEGIVVTGGIENVVETASASSGEVSDDIKDETDPAIESSASIESSSRLSGLLTFFKYPIFLLLAVFIVAIYLNNRKFKKRVEKKEDLEDFENLDDEKTQV